MSKKIKKFKSIPKFKNEDEERDFWAIHDTTEYFDISKPIKLDLSKLRPSTETISLRISKHLLDDIRTAANRRDIPYQSLIKVYLDQAVRSDKIFA